MTQTKIAARRHRDNPIPCVFCCQWACGLNSLILGPIDVGDDFVARLASARRLALSHL